MKTLVDKWFERKTGAVFPASPDRPELNIFGKSNSRSLAGDYRQKSVLRQTADTQEGPYLPETLKDKRFQAY